MVNQVPNFSRVRSCALGLLFIGLACLAGCKSEDASKTSHFEHDHEVAAHWPNGLADLSNKIRERLDRLSANPEEGDQLRSETIDLVSWTSEVAADTDLSEPDWIPLDNAAESLSAQLRAAGETFSQADLDQLNELCDLIEYSVTLIPTAPELMESESQ